MFLWEAEPKYVMRRGYDSGDIAKSNQSIPEMSPTILPLSSPFLDISSSVYLNALPDPAP